MRFTKIPENTFEQLQMNAGVIAKDFDPVAGTIKDEDLLGATTSGLSFSAVPSFVDMGENIDNCPKNTMELKKIDDVEVKSSGSFASVSKDNIKRLMTAADIDGNKITPRKDLKEEDFEDIWLVGDYGKDGYLAIHMMNVLSTGGFALQTTDKEKGQFAYDFTAHYSIKEQDVIPYEVYVLEDGTSAAALSDEE